MDLTALSCRGFGRPAETFSPPCVVTGNGDRYMFPLTLSNIALTIGHGPPARRGRRATASALTVGAAAIALLAFAHVSAATAEDASRMAQVQHACTVVMGLDPRGRGYATCIMSLNRSLSLWDQARLVKSDRNACSRKGLRPGTPAFAVCVVQADQSQ